jgi:hypothetical protein
MPSSTLLAPPAPGRREKSSIDKRTLLQTGRKMRNTKGTEPLSMELEEERKRLGRLEIPDSRLF